MPLRFKSCIDKGLLRKIPGSKDNALRSISKADNWLGESQKTFQGEAYDSSVMSSYLVMFHAARAVLFYDGYREKSHACVARYLEDQYVNRKKLEKKWVDLFDYHRAMRDLSFFSSKEEAQKAIESAEEFLQRIQQLFKSFK